MNETDRTPRTVAFVTLCERQLEQLTALTREALAANTPETFSQSGGRELSRRLHFQQNLVGELSRTRGGQP